METGQQPPPRQLGGLEERCKLPQRGPRRCPDRPKVFHYFQHSGWPILKLYASCGLSCSRWGSRPPVAPPCVRPITETATHVHFDARPTVTPSQSRRTTALWSVPNCTAIVNEAPRVCERLAQDHDGKLAWRRVEYLRPHDDEAP